MAHPSNDVVSRLLVSTVKNALRQPFYQALWADVTTSDIHEPSDLSLLPCVTKEMYRDAYMTSFDHTSSHYVSHSTGTTGALTLRHRSRVEETFIRWLLSPQDADEEDPRVGINLMSGLHGMQMPVPVSEISIPAATGSAVQLRQCIQLLTTSFRLHGRDLMPSYLSGRAVDVALVAQALRSHGVDPAGLSLRDVTVMGGVDEGLRQFINSAFDVPLYERYSTSEIFGGAIRAPGHDYYVTDACVVAEVCDEQGRALGDGGIGHLTMTELYPFVQIQPLIRYRTGDIVERVESSSPGQISFRFMGRVEQCVSLKRPGRADIVFAYRPLADVLGCLPMVTRRPANADSATRFGSVGLPLIELTKVAESQVCVRIGVSEDPFLYPRSTQEIVDRLWDTLGPSVAPEDHIEVIVELSSYDSSPGFDRSDYWTIQMLGPHRLASRAPQVR